MAEPPQTVVHTEHTVYEAAPWLKVVKAEITTPDGVDRSHHAIQLNVVASVAGLDDQGRVLLMNRHRWIVDQVGYETPGGIVDPGEQPEEAARRELLEETGFEVVGDLELVADIEPMPGLVTTRHFVYLARSVRQVGAPTDAEEAAQLVWVPVDRTTELLAAGKLFGTGTAVGMFAALTLVGRSTGLLEQVGVTEPKTT